MLENKRGISSTSAVLASLAMAMGMNTTFPLTNDAPNINFPMSHQRGKPKSKHSKPGSRVLRGYVARYTHVLSAYCAENNLAARANGKSGFKGFRKVRKYIPETRMTVWVHA